MDRPARSETETGDVGIAHREVVGESGLLNGIQVLRFAARQVMMAVVGNDEACRPLQMPFLGDDFVGLQAGTVTRMQADASARFGTEAREAVEEFEVEGIVRLILRSISPAFEEEKWDIKSAVTRLFSQRYRSQPEWFPALRSGQSRRPL